MIIYKYTVRRSNPGGGEIFRTRPDRPWGPPSLLYNRYRVFPGRKAAGAWRWPPTPSSTEVKEKVELYLYTPSGPWWPVIGWTLPLTLYIYISHGQLVLTPWSRITRQGRESAYGITAWAACEIGRSRNTKRDLSGRRQCEIMSTEGRGGGIVIKLLWCNKKL